MRGFLLTALILSALLRAPPAEAQPIGAERFGL